MKEQQPETIVVAQAGDEKLRAASDGKLELWRNRLENLSDDFEHNRKKGTNDAEFLGKDFNRDTVKTWLRLVWGEQQRRRAET